MSKKDRLKAQKQKQDKIKRELEEQERLDYEQSRDTESKAAKKLRKQAKRSQKGEPVGFLILKIVMLIPFLYSGIFYGSVNVLGTLMGYIEPAPPKWAVPCVIVGVAVMTVGVFFAFFKKYIVSLVLTLGGSIPYLKVAQYFIDYIQKKKETTYFDPSIENMDVEYMQRYYPIIAVPVIVFILLVCVMIIKLRKRKKLKHEQETAPVKSIVGEEE